MGAEPGLAQDEPRPRLLYVLTSFNAGGAEWGLVNLVRGGAFNGFELDVVALVRGAGAQIGPLQAAGCTPHVLVDRARPGPLALALAAWRLTRFMARRRPHVLVLSLPHANLLGRALRPGRWRPLVVSFEHNSHLARRAYEVGYRMTSQRVDWMLADCDATARAAEVRLYRKPPPRTDVLPLVQFTAERLARARRSVVTGARLRLISAARLTAPKNQAHLIALIAALLRRGFDAELTLYGEGPMRAALEARVQAEGLAGRVSLPGHQAGWMNTPGDMFVLASRHEGLCIAALEAMAAGLPVAAPLVGGLADYGPAALALALDGTDVEADADRLAAALQAPARLSAMSDAGRTVVAARYGGHIVRALYATFNARLRARVVSGTGPARSPHSREAP